DTYGFNMGGPLKIPGLNRSAEKKLFFFYSMETPQAQQPGGVRKYMMPTELERGGDFSQTFDAGGKLIVIKDPLTGQPFPGNVFTAIGHRHIFGSSMVNELYGGVRRQTEGFGTATDADLQRLLRTSAGFNVGQFHPELNPLGVLPVINLGLGNSGSGVSNTN